ncbi:MAG: CRISPR-associated helicase Cas3' [Methanobacteriota archaeon]
MLYSYNEILAKKDPDIPLYKHIEDSLNLFKNVKNFKEGSTRKFCEIYSLPEEEFWKSAFFCVALHDIGKASVSFQKYIRKEGKRKSHAFLSFWFTQQACSHYSWIEGERSGRKRSIPIEALIVANHHSPFKQGKFEDCETETNVEFPPIIQDVIKRISEETIQPKFEEHFGELFELSFTYPKKYSEIFNEYAIANDFIRVLRKQEAKKARILFAYLKDILHYCDWYSSQGDTFSFEYSPTIKEENIKRAVCERIGKETFAWHVFQKACRNYQGGAILQAPTGKGKTEASLLWAINNGVGKKLLYLMPTMTTTNKMYERMRHPLILGENIGIVHGTSDYLLLSEKDYQNSWEFIWNSLFCRAFVHKSTILTVDQLLFILFNWGRWDSKLSNAADSVLIFDEIHCYEPYTIALIVEATKFLRSLGAIPLFMSATFPDGLKTFLKDELHLGEIPHDASFDESHRVEIVWRYNEEIFGAKEDIIENYRNGRKVLVVCNTIRTAKEMYKFLIDKIPSFDLMLFHSQFILYHRMIKENQLENLPFGGFVAVTTQVVEVSLDIDFDLLYTEMCPIDALVQRFGRVNRRGKKEETKAFIYKPTKSSFYVYPKDVVKKSHNSLQNKSNKPSEKELLQAVNEVYADTDFRKELETVRDLIDYVEGNLSYVYTLSAKDKTIQKLTTRPSKYLTIDAIPKQFEEEIKSLDKKIKRVRYSVRIPLFNESANIFDFQDDLVIAKVEYDERIGVIFPRREIDENII